MECRVCGREVKLLEILKARNPQVTRVYAKETVVGTLDIPFYRCPYCTHGQTEYELSNQYYEEYKMINTPNSLEPGVAYTRSKLEYYNSQFVKLSNYCKNVQSVLDIGCGPGILLREASKYFENAVGVEPSKELAEVASSLGNVVINDFFNKKFSYPNKFSAFISTQVFEHLVDVKDVLECAYEWLEDEGVGFIEVPNGQKIMYENRYYDVLLEHINYFTILSLSRLVTECGFEILEIKEDFNRNYLTAFIVKTSQYTGFQNEIASDREKILNTCSGKEKISVWGAGTKARSFIEVIKNDLSIKYIFDSNQSIHDQYLGNCSIAIQEPTKEKIVENDIIIIFALEYKEEIKQILRKQYHYQGDIICMDEI